MIELIIDTGRKDETFVIQPASCACGGDTAILKRRSSGALQMIGCICHLTISDLLYEVDCS